MAKSLEELTEQIDLDVRHIPVEEIKPNPDNPNEMSDANYAALKDEIRDHGYTQPVLVRPLENGYQMIDGEHRWRAVSEIGFATVPAVVIESEEADAKVRLVAMNRLRGKFVPIKLAYVIADLAQTIPERELRKRLGMSESELHDHLQNANLADAVSESLSNANQRPEGTTVSVFCSDDDAAMIEATLELIAPTKEERGAALAKVCREWSEAQQA